MKKVPKSHPPGTKAIKKESAIKSGTPKFAQGKGKIKKVK